MVKFALPTVCSTLHLSSACSLQPSDQFEVNLEGLLKLSGIQGMHRRSGYSFLVLIRGLIPSVFAYQITRESKALNRTNCSSCWTSRVTDWFQQKWKRPIGRSPRQWLSYVEEMAGRGWWQTHRTERFGIVVLGVWLNLNNTECFTLEVRAILLILMKMLQAGDNWKHFGISISLVSTAVLTKSLHSVKRFEPFERIES